MLFLYYCTEVCVCLDLSAILQIPGPRYWQFGIDLALLSHLLFLEVNCKSLQGYHGVSGQSTSGIRPGTFDYL